MLSWRSEGSARVIPFEPVRSNLKSQPLFEVLAVMGSGMGFERNAEIFAEDEPAEYVYGIASGAVRICKLMSDGRRQISAFYLPGDIFGLEAAGHHSFSAEAVGDCRILVLKRTAFLAQAARDDSLMAQLWEHSMSHLRRAQSHMLLLGRKSAQERLASFLLDMAERLSKSGAIELPMSRQDIADYLGLTIETVSRTLTLLEREGLITIPASRRIVLRDRHGLSELDDCLAA